MNIYQKCIIDLLEQHGFIPEYVDSHQIDSVTYYFGGIGGLSIKLTRACVPEEVALDYLALFSLDVNIHQIQHEACSCNW